MYVTLRLGDGSVWAQSTDISPNRGVDDTQWKFEGDEMSGKVTSSHLAKNVINLTVKDSSDSSADKYVGKAKINLDDLLDATNTNKMLTLSGILKSHDSDNAGEYTIKIKFRVNANDKDEDVNDDMGDEENHED